MFQIGDKVQFVPGLTTGNGGGLNEERVRQCGLEMGVTYEIERRLPGCDCVIIRGYAFDMRRIEHAGGPW